MPSSRPASARRRSPRPPRSGAAMDAEIRRLPTLPDAALAPLVEESLTEGVSFVERLVREHRDGTNRFDRAGEVLFGATIGERLVGVCGLNRDPYLDDPRAGRVRHLYVLSAYRRR